MTTYPGNGGDDRLPEQYEPDPALASYPAPVWSPYGEPVPAAPLVPVKPSALPDAPRLYHQMLRGPRWRWWRPLLSLLLILPLAIPLWALSVIPVVVIGAARGVPNLGRYTSGAVQAQPIGPAGFLFLNLTLIALIPVAVLSIWIAHRIRPRFVASVLGGIRWRWLGRCALILLPLWALYIGISLLAETPSARPAHWGVLLAMVVVLTPLQAAGEEFFFRGWILQNVGSYFARPVLGIVVSVAVSTAAFSAAHGSPDPWVLGTIGCLAVASGLAAWRTGGLEAGIVMHTVNNVLTFFAVILVGGWNDAFVGATTTGTPLMFGIAVLVHGVALALVVWQARRAGIDRYYRPPVATPPEPLPVGPASWNPVAALNQTP